MQNKYLLTRPNLRPKITLSSRVRARLEGLFQDIAEQKFGGEVQLIVVDSGSRDGTREAALAHGAQIVPIDQASFSHPKALNLGFEAADHDLVLTLVGHSNLTSRVALTGITRWVRTPNLGGIYGPAALPDAHATSWEKLLAATMRLDRRLTPAEPLGELAKGAMVTHRAVFPRAVWRELGGFDLAYGAGGEDTAMARSIHAAGMKIVREPVLSIYHSHSTGPIGTVRQALEYRKLRSGAANAFDTARLSYRPSLRLHEQ